MVAENNWKTHSRQPLGNGYMKMLPTSGNHQKFKSEQCIWCTYIQPYTHLHTYTSTHTHTQKTHKHTHTHTHTPHVCTHRWKHTWTHNAQAHRDRENCTFNLTSLLDHTSNETKWSVAPLNMKWGKRNGIHKYHVNWCTWADNIP